MDAPTHTRSPNGGSRLSWSFAARRSCGTIDGHQRSFRRVKGHTQMANLVTVIGHTVNPVARPADYAQAVA